MYYAMCDSLADQLRDDEARCRHILHKHSLVAKHFVLCDENTPRDSSPYDTKFTVTRSHTNVLSLYCLLIIAVKGIVVKLVRTLADVLDRIVDV